MERFLDPEIVKMVDRTYIITSAIIDTFFLRYLKSIKLLWRIGDMFCP